MNVRRSTAVAALLLAAPVLTSCGFSEQTDQVYNAAAGVDSRSGEVDVLDAQIVSGQDGSGTVVAGLVNNDQVRGDRLTGIGPGNPGQQDVTASGPSGTSIPAGGDVQLGDTQTGSKGQWTVTGQTIVAGQFVKLTFTFARAQVVTLDVPVVSASNPMYSQVPLPSGS